MALALRNAQHVAPARASRSRLRCNANMPAKWPQQYAFLNEKGLRSIPPEDAEKMQQKSAVIVDVRPRNAYKKSHIAGSVSVPLYQELDMSSGQIFSKALKFVAYAANGVSPIEPNPNFDEELKAALSGKDAIFVCEAGGTMKPSVNFPTGKASRSLQACVRAYGINAAKNIMHLERGVYGWYQADLPFEGEEEYKPEIGRSPMAAAEPTLKVINQSTGYEIRPGEKMPK